MENYFNFFTEIEECFRRCRGTPTLLSPLDWALIESWKDAGIPLDAALAGIEQAFAKYAKRPRRFRKINGLAYCSQSVLRAAENLRTTNARRNAKPMAGPSEGSPFRPEEVQSYVQRNAAALEKNAHDCQVNDQQILAQDLVAAAGALRNILEKDRSKLVDNLEELETRLSALEDKLTASMTRAAPVELLTQFRQQLEHGLSGSRRELSAAQFESLERQYLKKRLFEHYQVPRLSLFYY